MLSSFGSPQLGVYGPLDALAALSPRINTGSDHGQALDLDGQPNDITGILSVGSVSGTYPTLDGSFESSDDNSGWTAVPGSAFRQAVSSGLQLVKFARTGRYIRYVWALGGSNPSFAQSVVVVVARRF